MDLVSLFQLGKADRLVEATILKSAKADVFFVLSPVTTSAVRSVSQETDSCPGKMKALTFSLSGFCEEGGPDEARTIHPFIDNVMI